MKKYFTAKNISLLAIVLTIIFFLYKCPFWYILGVPCPGCGMTRAFKSVLMLDFERAFSYHPLWPMVILLFIGWILDFFKVIQVKYETKQKILFIACLLLVLVYILRFIYGSEIVCIDIQKGLLYQIVQYIIIFFP